MKGLLGLLVLLALAACDGGQEVPRLLVEPEELVLWEPGQRAQVRLTQVAGDDARQVAAEAWESTDPAVIQVDESGQVTAVGPGEARVVAVYRGERAEARVRVEPDGLPLSGRITYPDRRYDAGGFTGEVRPRPVRFARLAVLDGQDRIRLQGYTDGDGRFDLGRVVPLGLRLVVYSETDPTSGHEVTVAHPRDGALFAVSRSLDGLSGPLQWHLEAGPEAAFNILDVMVSGREFMAALGAPDLPPLQVYWAPEGSQGTYYCTGAAGACPQGTGIYVLEGFADGDAYDDDVLWHEFGHFVSDRLSRDTSPGGCHFLQSTDLDLRLAWSEGWGDFLPAAIKRWLTEVDPQRSSLAAGAAPSLYVDTNGRDLAIISIDIADPAAGAAYDPYRYASNEIAVANLLWQLQSRYGMAAVWRVLGEYFPATFGPVNLETFWDGWLQVNPPGAGLGVLEALFASREVHYRADEYEGDDAAGTRLLVSGETHTLYGAADEDWVALSLSAGESVTLRTTGLTNGADTHLEVYDPDGLLVAANDDDPQARPYYDYDLLCGESRYINDGGRLASRVSFQAAKSGLYQVRVRSTPDADPYPAAGRYGGYRLVRE